MIEEILKNQEELLGCIYNQAVPTMSLINQINDIVDFAAIETYYQIKFQSFRCEVSSQANVAITSHRDGWLCSEYEGFATHLINNELLQFVVDYTTKLKK